MGKLARNKKFKRSLCPYARCRFNCTSIRQHKCKYASIDKKTRDTKYEKKRSPKINYLRLEQLGIFL